MGYYTYFKLEDARVPGLSKEESLAVVLKTFNTDVANLLTGNENYKWYDYQKDCLNFSQQNPEIAFKISGVGEEVDDVWWNEYYGGKLTNFWKKPETGLALSQKTLALVTGITTGPSSLRYNKRIERSSVSL